MKFRRPKSFLAMAWILAVALIVTPLMAQNPPAQGLMPTANEDDEATSNTQQDATSAVTGQSSAPLGTSVLVALPVTRAGAAFPNVANRSILITPPSTEQRNAVSKPAGETKWIILAAVVITGAVVAAILLFPGHKGDKSNGPAGTILAAGTPAIGIPPKR